MRIYQLYKHVNNRDVAMMPLKVFKVPGQERYKLKVRWFNVHYNEIGCRPPFDISFERPDSLDIQKDVYDGFKLYIPEDHWNTYKR